MICLTGVSVDDAGDGVGVVVEDVAGFVNVDDDVTFVDVDVLVVVFVVVIFDDIVVVGEVTGEAGDDEGEVVFPGVSDAVVRDASVVAESLVCAFCIPCVTVSCCIVTVDAQLQECRET